MTPFFTVMRLRGRPRLAGPCRTAPVLMLNLLPWQGQLMVPPLTLPTVQPIWGQMALKHLKTLADGLVTTYLPRMIPPPIGMLLVLARTGPAAFASASSITVALSA